MAKSLLTSLPKFFLLLATSLFFAACSDGDKAPIAAQITPEQTPDYKLAVAGDAKAQYRLAVMYDTGKGAPKDATKAVEWYEKSATQGNAQAQGNLAVKYYNGDGVPKNATKAVEWYLKAATQGDAASQFILGDMYHKGDSVAKDAGKGAEWFGKAAAQGDAAAQLKLGGMYYIGDGVQQDATKAAEWFEKAAAQGDTTAQYYIGLLFYKGDGVSKDAIKAAEWFYKAAKQENADAQFVLGRMYYQGEGVPLDLIKAGEWLQKAAKQGEVNAQLILGKMYFHGQGVPKDGVLGYAWVNLGAATGHEDAVATRKYIEQELSPASIAEAERISSAWKKGEPLAREAQVIATTSSSIPATPETLIKQGTGTAFLVAKTGQAITNYHVTDGCTEMRVQGRKGTAKLVTSDKINDLALLQISGLVSAAAPLSAEPNKLRQGEDIAVYGFPLNSVLSSGGNFTLGVISALTGLGNNTSQIQITAPIQPGSSGSAVLNKKGEVVGIVSMKLSDTMMAKATGQVGQNVNFAVSGQTLKSFLDAHQVPYSSGSGFLSREKSTADLAEEARKWTLLVECWK
jgi:TPR repeat protein